MNLFAQIAPKWTGVVGTMPRLEDVLARPESTDHFSDLDRLLQAAQADLHGLVDPSTGMPLSLSDEPSARFGWLVNTLRVWNETNDPHDRRLYGALTAAAAWDLDGSAWHELSSLLPNSDRLVAALDRILCSRQIIPTVPPGTPLWERARLEKLLSADKREDWISLVDLVGAFGPPIADVGFKQSACALLAIDPVRLIAFAGKLPTWFAAAALLKALTPAAACKIATRSGSARVRFTTLELITRTQSRLSHDEEDALYLLLDAAAKEDALWSSFAKAFFRIPARHPNLLRPLGKVLAGASKVAIEAYVDAIDLEGGDDSAACAAACLSEFRRCASIETRRVLWDRAYERWDKWDYGQLIGKELIEPIRSTLDFAVVGWLVESAPVGFIQSGIGEFGAKLQMIEADWHASVTAFRTDVNRLLSRHLLLVRAQAITAGTADWLHDVRSSPPIEMSSAYAKARFVTVA